MYCFPQDEHKAVLEVIPTLFHTNPPRYLSDETFQREIMVSPIDNSKAENLLWMVERQVIESGPK